jgi:hypothetical protein
MVYSWSEVEDSKLFADPFSFRQSDRDRKGTREEILKLVK